MKIQNLGLVILLLLPAGAARAQQSQQQQPAPTDQQQPNTLAYAARRTRDQKKEQAKPARTWDNDNIPSNPNEVSVVGQAAADTSGPTAASTDNAAVPAPAANAGAAAPPAEGAANQAAKPADNKAEIESQLSAAKELLKSLQKDLDVLQRQYTLDQQSFYGKTNFAADKDGAAKLKAEGDQVDAKRQEVGAAQAKVDELQAKLGPPPNDGSKPN
jgi:hypothetical protein